MKVTLKIIRYGSDDYDSYKSFRYKYDYLFEILFVGTHREVISKSE